MWKKEKMLVTSIFFFSHNVFYPLKTNSYFSATFILLYANAFNFDQSKNFLLGKELNLTLPNNRIVNLSKLKAIAGGKIIVTQKLKFILGRIENVGKGENAGYPHFLLFPLCLKNFLYAPAKQFFF